MIGRIITLLVLIGGIVQAQDAVAPQLEPPVLPTIGYASPPAPAAEPEVTICIDRAARQCWTANGRASCQSARPAAEVFDVMPARSNAAGSALRACWASVTRTPRSIPQS